jgi:hypothetical protein
MAQICFMEEDIPKDLLPINNNVGTIKPTRAPPTYYGQGLLKISIIYLLFDSEFNEVVLISLFLIAEKPPLMFTGFSNPLDFRIDAVITER